MKYYIYNYFNQYGICREGEVPRGATISAGPADSPDDLRDELQELRSTSKL